MEFKIWPELSPSPGVPEHIVKPLLNVSGGERPHIGRDAGCVGVVPGANGVIGADPGADPGANPGAWPGADPGADPGAWPGADPGEEAIGKVLAFPGLYIYVLKIKLGPTSVP